MQLGSPIHFVTKHRAKFEEMDPFGHVNVNHYLSYFSENRFAGHRTELNMTIGDLAKLPIAFHTRVAHLEFISPVFADNEFEISSYIADVTEGSCKIESKMYNPKKPERIHATCQFILVCVDKQSGKSTTWPSDFISRYFTIS